MMYTLWLACDTTKGGSHHESTAPSGPEYPPAWAEEPLNWEIDPPYLVAPYACSPAREPDFADWPGGARMHLVADPFVVGDPPDIVLTGAQPVERIEVYAGSLCALDCPQPDGGCFQAAEATRIAELVADDAGIASGEVVPPVELLGEWVVLQATAPDAPERYVSQPVVDHTGPSPGPPIPGGILRVVGPATVRSMVVGYETWSFPVAAGRRSEITLDLTGFLYFKSNYNDLSFAVDGATSLIGRPESDAAFADERATPSRWTLTMGGTPDPYDYDVEFRLLPLDQPMAWLDDADGDGAGDQDDPVATSAVPVPGATTAGGDCDDADPLRHPSAAETCDDGVDQDCDGADRPCEGVGPVGTAGTRVRGVAYAGVGLSVAGADIDGDGVVELLAGSSAAYGVSLSGDAGGFSTIDRADLPPGALTTWPPASASTVAMGRDLDGDGAEELVLVRDGVVVSLYGDLADRVPERSLTGVNLGIDGIDAADATGDGVSELFVSGSNGPWAGLTVFGDPLGAIALLDTHAYAPGGPGTPADFDGDGIADWLDPGGCLWSGPLPYDTWAWCAPVAHAVAGEVDGDGRPDVIGAVDDEVRVISTPGADPSVVVALAFEPSAVSWLVDEDGLGRPWVEVAEATGVSAYVVPLRGPGTWDLDGVMVWTGAALGAADFDGDGAVDLAIGRPTVGYGAEPAAGEVWVSWGAFDAVP